MSKRYYYYTCPIKALYMMKEFGVKFYTKGFLDVESDFLEKELGFHLEIRTLYNKLCENGSKIYVPKELEHIFEPKEGDKDENGLFFDGRHWTDGFSYAISFEQSKTSFRFGKQFFMPEVEND